MPEALAERLLQRFQTLEEQQQKTAATLAKITQERDKLRRDYDVLREQLQLLSRQIFAAKAERINTAQLEMEFADTRKRLEEMVSLDPPSTEGSKPACDDKPSRPTKNRKPHGRRDLSLVGLPKERCEITDEALEAAGAERIGFELSYKLGYKRGGAVCIEVARAKYKVPEAEGSIVTAPLPKEVLSRGLCAPSMVAKLLVDKFADGLPFFRQEQRFAREGLPLDRSQMCRIAEEVGMTLGCIVLAARDEAMKHAFCLATDATGIALQPTRLEDGKRQACRKGHFFVTLADRDHIFFSFEPHHTSAAVCSMFAGYTGYIQADASAVYNALFRADAEEPGKSEQAPSELPKEVGCWAHARRKFYEAAITTKDPRAQQALLRIRMLFEKEAEWQKLAPDRRGALRASILKPWLDDFFAWAEPCYQQVKDARGTLATAFGYATRQRGPLSQFLADGRLRIDNNRSERALRPVAVGRKAWLFFGSDDHAEAAANLMGLIASCKLHAIDPTTYFEAVIRIVPYWPRGRFLELAPKYWNETRARLSPAELDAPLGPITVPPKQ
jgi:transposase